MVPRVMPLVLGESQEVREGFDGWRRPYIRSSLSVVHTRWMGWMPHPSARRQWPQVDHGSIPRDLHAHGAWNGPSREGGVYLKK